MVTFVSNTGQIAVASGYYTHNEQRAQQFTTGDHAAGYALSEVVVDIGKSCSIAPAFSLHSSTTDALMLEVPGGRVVDLVGSAASLGEQSFYPASATTLARATKYFVVFRTGAPAETTDCKLGRTLSQDVDNGAASGWDLASSAVFSPDSGATWTITHSLPEDPLPPIKIAIRGSFVETGRAPGRPEDLTATPGDGEVTLRWERPLDDGGSAIIRYEIRYAAGTSVSEDTSWQSAGLDLERTIDGLTNGQEYAFQVRAVNRVGAGAVRTASATPVATPLAAPGAPRTLTAEPGDQEVVLTWTTPLDDGGSAIIRYEYRYARGSSVPLSTSWQSAGLDLERTIDGLTSVQQYTFEVRAVNGIGAGAVRTASAAPLAAAPGAPRTLTAEPGDQEVVLTWTTPLDDGGSAIIRYEFRYATGTSVSEDTSWQSAGLDLERTINALTNGQQYTFEVRAVNRVGAGAMRTASATPVAAPGAPRTLTTEPGDQEVVLTWTTPLDNGGSAIIRYEYRYARGSSVPSSTSWQSAGLDLERTIDGLTSGQQYTFEVRAVNGIGAGAVRTASAAPLAAAPGALRTLTAEPGDQEVVLTWTTPLDDGGAPVTGYELRYAAGTSVSEDTSWQSAGLDLERTIDGLSNGQVYTFQVRAVNRVGAGAVRAASATPVAAPGAPRTLTAEPGDQEVVLTWTTPLDDGGTPVAGYEFRYAAGTSVTEATPWQSAGLDRKRTIGDLTNGEPYAFEVRALNRVGAGPARGVVATPVGPPGAPRELAATPGDTHVVLAWTAPLDDGGAPVTGYEIRYAAGTSVSEDTSWQSVGLDVERTIDCLTNGQQYTFEVRAVNRVGAGAVRTASATPVAPPGAPWSLTAEPGDEEVVLTWTTPLYDGGTPVTGYEFRYAVGTPVTEATPWQSAGLDRKRTIGDLTNGEPYAFEVRALNRVGAGPARGVVATPAGPPGAPRELTATPGDTHVVLAWAAPSDDGGTPVTGYEYRYSAGDTVPDGTPWRDAGAELMATVTGLENEIRHAFEVRALNSVGPGAVARTGAMPILLLADLFSVGKAAEGEPFVIGVRRSGGLAHAAHAVIGVTDSAVPGVTAMDPGRDDGLGRHRLEFAAGEAEATVTVTPAFDTERRTDRLLTATLEAAAVEIDGVTLTYQLLTPTLEVAVSDRDAALSVADARVEDAGAALLFRVSLDRTRDVPVRADYATSDGSAKAGQDYSAATGTLTIPPGQREATVEVAVLPAPHLSGERTLVLTLSNARDALIADSVATGAIVRQSALPEAWLSRFGRTAADQASQAIARRLEEGQREIQVTVAGRRLDTVLKSLRAGLQTPRAMTTVALATFLGAGTSGRPGTHTDSRGNGSDAAGGGLSFPTMRDALIGSSFYVEGGAQADADEGAGSSGPRSQRWAAWGDVATTRFAGDASGLALDGDVVTVTAGLDRQLDARRLVGLAASYSDGIGTYRRGGGAGTITSTLASVHPYARYRVGERTQLWGALGYGRGRLGLVPERGDAIYTDLSNAMVAMGGRGVLMGTGAAGSFEIALRSDLLWTHTTSEAALSMAEAAGAASRVRTLLEGTGNMAALGGTLRPTLEAGLRYDGGDAETGAGMEVGGGLGWYDGSLTVQVNARALVAHADESYEERGYSASVVYGPGQGGRGLRMRLDSGWGATQSGVQHLWSQPNASGLVHRTTPPGEQRFGGEVGVGLGADRLWYPYIAADAAGENGRTMRFGVKLTSGQRLGVGLELGRRGHSAMPPEDVALLRGQLRF